MITSMVQTQRRERVPDPTFRPGDIVHTIEDDAVRLIKRPQASTDGMWVVRYLDGRLPPRGSRYSHEGLWEMSPKALKA